MKKRERKKVKGVTNEIISASGRYREVRHERAADDDAKFFLVS